MKKIERNKKKPRKLKQQKSLKQLKRRKREREKKQKLNKIVREQAKFHAEEKKNLENFNTIKVLYNCVYGKSIYIIGEDTKLGSWQTAYKLNVMNAGEWRYRSNNIKDGMTFKMII